MTIPHSFLHIYVFHYYGVASPLLILFPLTAVLIMETVNTCVNFSHINLTTPSGSVEHSENQRRNCPVRIMSKNKERILCMDKKGNVHHKASQKLYL